jgi:hypothetical protein
MCDLFTFINKHNIIKTLWLLGDLLYIARQPNPGRADAIPRKLRIKSQGRQLPAQERKTILSQYDALIKWKINSTLSLY